jgi:hypothetical protein
VGHEQTEAKEEVTYTPRLVERLLKSYLDIRYTLEGKSPELPDTYAVVHKRTAPPERTPFGMTASATAWPFMEKRPALHRTDGKKQARTMEELHVACLDIENALQYLSNDDLTIVYQYLIFQTHTLDELVAERGLVSRGSMQSRVKRIVKRVTKLMENRRSDYS